jgi:hypothetical protein
MKKLITLIAVASFGITINAQTNFTGSWSLKEKKHITGPEYGNALPSKLKVEQKTDSVIIESTNMGNEGKETTSRQAIAMNGKTQTINSATSKRKYVRSLAWSADKKSLILTTLFYIPENENEIDFTRIETWTLADGNLSINKKSVETRSETWEVNGIFEKQ